MKKLFEINKFLVFAVMIFFCAACQKKVAPTPVVTTNASEEVSSCGGKSCESCKGHENCTKGNCSDKGCCGHKKGGCLGNSKSGKQGVCPMLTKKVQKALNGHGISVAIDGQMGPETKSAIKKFQKQNALPITGKPDRATLLQLGL
jgi:Putative peptidoglycan binding domain